MDTTLTILLVFVGSAIGFWLRRKFGPQATSNVCLHCGSKKLTEIKRDTLSTQTVEQHSGGFGGGGDVRLQSEEAVTYRCNDCNQTSTVTVRRTN